MDWLEYGAGAGGGELLLHSRKGAQQKNEIGIKKLSIKYFFAF